MLDEADEMLNMGFQEDIEFILKNTPARKVPGYSVPPCHLKSVRLAEVHEGSKEVTVGKVNTANKVLITNTMLPQRSTGMKH